MRYSNPPLILTDSCIADARGTIHLDDLPDPSPQCRIRLAATTPLMERLWRIALSDIEKNIITTDAGRYFGAGTSFGPRVYTRDISFFDEEDGYHNNSSWPFVDTFFIRALEKSDGVDRTALNAALLARTCVGDGSFHEVTDYRTREVKGSGAQLWTAASFIDTCRRRGCGNRFALFRCR